MIITTSRPSMSAKHLGQRLVQRSGLLLGVADRREDLRSAPPRDIGGVVGAVVGHDHHLLRTSRLPPQRLQRRSDRQALVVRRHQHGQAQRLLDEHPWRSGPEAAGGRLRLVDEPDRRRTERSQHQAAQPAHLRRQRRRNPPVAGEHAHRRRRVQCGQSHEDTGHGGAGGHYQRAGRNVVVGAERKPSDDVPRIFTQRDPYRQRQQDQGQRDQRHCEKAQPSHSPTARKLIDHRHRRTVSRSLDGADDEMASARRHHRCARGARAWPTREQAVVE